jgi:hypothetical protein
MCGMFSMAGRQSLVGGILQCEAVSALVQIVTLTKHASLLAVQVLQSCGGCLNRKQLVPGNKRHRRCSRYAKFAK